MGDKYDDAIPIPQEDIDLLRALFNALGVLKPAGIERRFDKCTQGKIASAVILLGFLFDVERDGMRDAIGEWLIYIHEAIELEKSENDGTP